MTAPTRRLRIACYVAGLTGLGHYTRMATLAGTLAERHEVLLVNGGRGQAPAVGLEQLDLPALPEVDGVITVPGPGYPRWAMRAQAIASAIGALRPDVVLVEHYPFSKWELAPEIDGLLDSARAANPAVVALASVRDIVGRTRRERIGQDEFAAQVIERMASFDGLLVHGDPALIPLSASFGAADRLPVPVHHTGYVVDTRLVEGAAEQGRSGVLVAAGGGAGQEGFLMLAGRAASALADGAAVEAFTGPFGDAGAADGSNGDAPASTRTDYLGAMRRSAAAITRAGYNTAVELWAAGVPAVLVPDRRMSDQVQRAQAFAARGAGIAVDEDELLAEAPHLRARLADVLGHRGVIDVGGAPRARELIEEWCRSGGVDG